MKKQIETLQGILKRGLLSKILPNYKLNHKDEGIINFIDVGSIGGLPEPWYSNAHRIKYLLNFEPNDRPIKGKNFTTYNTALWDKEEVRPFYITKGLNGHGSSLFKSNVQYVKDNFKTLSKRGSKRLAASWIERSQLVNTLELSCKTLDNILEQEFPKRKFHFLKIDAQGAESRILKGAEDFLLNSCVGLHLELFELPMYMDIELLDTVTNYLKRFGFSLQKKFPAHGTFASQHDCLFLKENGNDEIISTIRTIYKT